MTVSLWYNGQDYPCVYNNETWTHEGEVILDDELLSILMSIEDDLRELGFI